jgi:hypothetical protein
MIKSGISKIIGKTVSDVVVAEGNEAPRRQVILVFSDGTSLELWGADINCPGSLYPGGVDAATKYVQRIGAQITVYPIDHKQEQDSSRSRVYV